MIDESKIEKYDSKLGLEADDETNVRCPYCGCDHEDTCEFPSGLVTYWGQQSARTEFSCDACDQDFYVEECVTRSFTSFKAED